MSDELLALDEMCEIDEIERQNRAIQESSPGKLKGHSTLRIPSSVAQEIGI